MNLLKENKDRVRILIGTSKKGSTGIKQPIKTITLVNTTVKEVYKKLIKFFLKEDEQ